MVADKVPTTVLEDLYRRFFEVVSHRRSRRVGMGGGIRGGALKYQSPDEPHPLSDAELALLCFAAAGQSGYTPLELRGAIASTLRGRTFASPCNTQRTHLLFTNDEGVFLYRPRDLGKAVTVQGVEDLEKVIDNFKDDVVKLQDGRLNLPAGSGGIGLANEGHCNIPGQTVFIPIVDPSDEIINMALLSIDGMKQLFIDDDGEPAGVEKWVDKMGLKVKVPLSIFEPYIASWCTMEAGFILQNLMLATEAMGLASFPFGGFTSLIVMGGTPITRGLGFRFITDKAGFPNPVGIDGLLEGFCPPYYTDMASAVTEIVKKKYAEGGAYNPEGTSPFLDQKTYAERAPKLSDDAIACTQDLCTYIYNKYGRFPGRVDTMVLPLMAAVQHVDIGFYEQYCQPELLGEVHRRHMKEWHSV